MLSDATNRKPIATARHHGQSTLSAKKVPVSTKLCTKTSAYATSSRYTTRLPNPKSTACVSSSVKKEPIRMSPITRPSAIGRCGQSVASLSSSPLSPSVSNGRASSNSDCASDRSIQTSISKTTIERLTSIRPLNSQLSASTTNQSRISSSSTALSPTSNQIPNKSRVITPRTTRPVSVLPKLMSRLSNSSKSDTSKKCDAETNSILKSPTVRSSNSFQSKQATSIIVMSRVATSNSAKSQAPTSAQKALLPCGRSSNSTGNVPPKQAAGPAGRLNNLVAVVHPQKQQNELVKYMPVAPSTSIPKVHSGTLEMVGKQQADYAAHFTTKEESTTIKLKTTPRESKSENNHGAKNEAANSDHKDVNGQTATVAAATREPTQSGYASGESCLQNDLRARQDGKEGLGGRGENGFVSGHELANAGVESKQARDEQGSALEKTEEPIGRTTSGQNDLDGHCESKANVPSKSGSCQKAPVANPSPAVSLKSTSLLGRDNIPGLELKTKSLTTSKNDKSGQSVSARDSQTASSSANYGGSLDIKQHEKQPQTNGCLPGQNRSKLSVAHTRTPNLQQKKRDEPTNSYKCLNHKLGTKGINLPQSTRPLASGWADSKHDFLSHSLCFKSGNTRTSASSTGPLDADDAHPISESHSLSEPMGHQVLSLMMLDAGLLPAGKDQPANEEMRGHVCLQSEPSFAAEPNCLLGFHAQAEGRGAGTNNININFETFKHNWLAQRDASSRLASLNRTVLNPSESYLDDSALFGGSNHTPREFGQSGRTFRLNNFHLERLNTKKYGSASVSLPSSPRASRGERFAQSASCFQKFNTQLSNLRGSDEDTSIELSLISNCLKSLGTPAAGSCRKGSLCHDDNKVEANSDASSCSSLHNHCPPMLSLLNPLDNMEFSKFIRANVDESGKEVTHSTSGNILIAKTKSEVEIQPHDQYSSKLPQSSLSTKQLDQIQTTQEPLEANNPVCEDNLASKIDRLDELGQVAERKRELSASNSNESEFESTSNCDAKLKSKKDSPINVACVPQVPCEISKIKPLFDQGEDHPLELPQSAGRQPRSNSISGQEFHHTESEFHNQRLRQQNHGPFVDPSHYYDFKLRDHNPNQYNGSPILADRSMSPPNLSGRPRDFYVPKRSSSIKYQHDTKQTLVRNQIHASLECLNTMYSEYGQQNQKQQLPLSNHHARHYNHLHYQQQQHPNFQSNPYAATYVLTAAPAETVVNHNAEQDLAAAAMATPQQYDRALSSSSNSSNNINNTSQISRHDMNHHYQAQGAFNNRSAVPISQSPMHRRLVHGPMANILNQITSSTSSSLRAGHSSLSLASSTYLIEEKLQTEIKQLQSELKSEKEKNEALNSQLNINSNLMAAFEQSLTTLNNRLRQMTALNERKDKEIDELSAQLRSSNLLAVDLARETSEKSTSPICSRQNDNISGEATVLYATQTKTEAGEQANEQVTLRDKHSDERSLLKIIEDLKRQLIEKDRLLTDTRLEALSAAHQLEQLESRLNGEQSILVNEDDLDEGVMVANHSPSDSDAITDSLHNNDHKSNNVNHIRSNNHRSHQLGDQSFNDNSNTDDMILFTPTHGHNISSESHTGILSNNDGTNEMAHLNCRQHHDNQSDHSSSDFHDEDGGPGDTLIQLEYNAGDKNSERTFKSCDKDSMNKMLEKFTVTS